MEIRDTRNGEWYWVNNAVLACKHITHAEKSVYSALATFSGCKEIHPDFKTLAKRANVSEKWAKNAIKKLIEVGYLSVKKGGGRGHSNVYNLLKVPKGCRLCTLSKGGTKFQKRVNKVPIKGVESTPQLDKEVDKEKDNIVIKDNEWDFSSKLEEMKKDKRHIQIIALYWIYKQFSFNNKKQYQAALRRELRPANNLTGYSDSKILSIMDYLKNESDLKKWTLETVHKYIDETIESDYKIPDYAKNHA